METLASETDNLINHSFAASTWKTYKTAVDSLHIFRNKYNTPDIWPVPLDHLMNFVAYLSCKGLSSSTASTYISGIGHAHRIRGLDSFTNNFLLVKMLEGMRRRVQSRDIRVPISLTLLRRLIHSIKFVCSSNYEARMFSSAFSLAFFALLRIGEIACDSKAITGEHVIHIEDVSYVENPSGRSELYLKIRSSKADQRKESVTLILREQAQDICPLKLLRIYLSMRHPASNKPLFLHFDGSSLTRYQFNSVLKKALDFCGVTAHVRSHSLRIGGATELSRAGVPDADIKRWGRWASNAFSGYIRLDRTVEM